MRTLLIWLIAAPLAWSQALPTARTGASPKPAAGGVVYVIEEYMEGTGTPAGATDGNTVNWDYTTVALQGSQSWFSSTTGYSYFTIADANFYEAVITFRVADSTPTSTRQIAGFGTSANAVLCRIRIDTTGHLMVYTNGADSTPTTDAISDATQIWAKLIWNDGGTCSVEWNTSPSFSGSGSKFTSATGGTTTDCTRFYLGASSSQVNNLIIDSVRVAAAVIP